MKLHLSYVDTLQIKSSHYLLSYKEIGMSKGKYDRLVGLILKALVHQIFLANKASRKDECITNLEQ